MIPLATAAMLCSASIGSMVFAMNPMIQIDRVSAVTAEAQNSACRAANDNSTGVEKMMNRYNCLYPESAHTADLKLNCEDPCPEKQQNCLRALWQRTFQQAHIFEDCQFSSDIPDPQLRTQLNAVNRLVSESRGEFSHSIATFVGDSCQILITSQHGLFVGERAAENAVIRTGQKDNQGNWIEHSVNLEKSVRGSQSTSSSAIRLKDDWAFLVLERPVENCSAFDLEMTTPNRLINSRVPVEAATFNLELKVDRRSPINWRAQNSTSTRQYANCGKFVDNYAYLSDPETVFTTSPARPGDSGSVLYRAPSEVGARPIIQALVYGASDLDKNYHETYDSLGSAVNLAVSIHQEIIEAYIQVQRSLDGQGSKPDLPRVDQKIGDEAVDL